MAKKKHPRKRDMAFSGAKERARSRPKKKQSRKEVERVLSGPVRSRRTTRPSEVTFPELGNLKDAILMRHAKSFSDSMFESEEALEAATSAKQAVRSRMSHLNASLFTGHGYEFTRSEGEEKFTARKVKRGSKPADTVAPTARPNGAADEDLDNGGGDDADLGGGESIADA